VSRKDVLRFDWQLYKESKIMDKSQTPSEWAKQMLETNFAIIDTETTGLGEHDQIIQIGALLNTGETFQSYVKPTVPVSPRAISIHGISEDYLRCAPPFDEIFLSLWRFLGIERREILIYNADFDLRMIKQSLKSSKINIDFPQSERKKCKLFPNGGRIYDVMAPFSEYCGDWNEYYGNFRWQKLPGGDHTALGDCRATLDVLKEMSKN
jgi:DNA polymerase III subunit epsilon